MFNSEIINDGYISCVFRFIYLYYPHIIQGYKLIKVDLFTFYLCCVNN